MKYTPGPWKCKSAWDGFLIEPVDETQIEGIARVYRKPNAHIITAAPEMYELLKKAAPYVSICDDEMEGHGNAGEVFSEIKNLLRRIDGKEDHND